MSQQEKYRQFAHAADDLPLFMQPWYLDAVCEGGVWDAVLVEKGGRTVAAMPYFLKRKWLWNYVAMPQVCKFLGPYLLPEFRHPDGETRLYEALLAQLPRDWAAMEQDLNDSVTNWLPFYWRGFRQSTRYSYVIDLDRPEATLFEAVAKNYRKKILAARDNLLLRHDLPLSELQRLINLSFARQGLPEPLSAAFFQRVYEALAARSRCRLFFAVDAAGALHSASLLAWDRQSAYYLVSGDDPQHRASGSALLLKWEAILYAKHTLQLPVFDFEGSMIKALEIGRRDFGARQKPYFRVQREWSLWWKWAKCLLSR